MTAPKPKPRRGCANCGGPCTVDAVDNFGNPYKGCPNCRVKSLNDIAVMTASKPPEPPERVTLYWDNSELFTFSDESCGSETSHVYLRADVVAERERVMREALAPAIAHRERATRDGAAAIGYQHCAVQYLDAVIAALDWAKDTGECHFCGYDSPAKKPHGDECPLKGIE